MQYSFVLAIPFVLHLAAASAVPVVNGAASLEKRYPCYVTVWEGDGFTGESWGSQGGLTCQDLPGHLQGRMSSFEVRACSCNFFEETGCQGFRFNANERSDGEMWKNGDDNNRIKSFSCNRCC
ncbi:hypothetical protein Dda_4845 [Drechslerella dactyloides]|uniref:Uncharacterized protein n=1 Tax=Drechslerella dactyloides TaxID=74499 RepID=A0AAD6NJG1_DREDA|nr:hypothetical protein Dda_4845 [Drechslerella dactyloides]